MKTIALAFVALILFPSPSAFAGEERCEESVGVVSPTTPPVARREPTRVLPETDARGNESRLRGYVEPTSPRTYDASSGEGRNGSSEGGGRGNIDY